MSLSVHNTLGNSKEKFIPIEPGKVRMFVCGPTVYDLSHVGHAKTYTHFDLVARYLRRNGYAVTYVQNLTDVDDKIIAKANAEGVAPGDLAERYELLYLQDMESLHNTSVDQYARAHDHIAEIVSQVKRLAERGHAYRIEDGWYFDLSSFPEYGKLSGRTQALAEDSVSRVDENPGKRNAGDFALWKARKPGEPHWDTPLGPGRPGWHIEDTAITEALLGAQYDLHGGALDLVFPHHEAEIAQMEAASGKAPLARYWMHTGLLRVGRDKMSKSLGNFLTIRQALEQADFRTLRYAFLTQHYRTSMELNEEAFTNARNGRKRVENFARTIERHKPSSETEREHTDEARAEFVERMNDDFDTPGAISALFTCIRNLNKVGERPGASAWDFLAEIDNLFDMFDLGAADAPAVDGIEDLIERRRALRQEKRFKEADAVRADLLRQGIVLEDTSSGTRWWRA